MGGVTKWRKIIKMTSRGMRYPRENIGVAQNWAGAVLPGNYCWWLWERDFAGVSFPYSLSFLRSIVRPSARLSFPLPFSVQLVRVPVQSYSAAVCDAVVMLLFSHTVCWTICEYHTRASWSSIFFSASSFRRSCALVFGVCFSRPGSLGLFVGKKENKEIRKICSIKCRILFLRNWQM